MLLITTTKCHDDYGHPELALALDSTSLRRTPAHAIPPTRRLTLCDCQVATAMNEMLTHILTEGPAGNRLSADRTIRARRSGSCSPR